MISVYDPSLIGGHFDVTFGKYEKVVNCMAFVNEPLGAADNGKIYRVKATKATNVVTVTILKADLETDDADRDWEVAVNADVATTTVTVLADCI